MRKMKILSLCVSAVTAGLYFTPVQAQDAPAAEEKKKYASSVEEVVVTARKTEEDIQTVPLAIQALGAEQLEARAISNLEDIANATPGLNYAGGSSSGYQSSATIRGLAQGFLQDRTQNVAIFFNGIYLQRQSMANISQVDLQGIEVLKGPQSALYGRNAFSGAIAYTTKKPTDEFEGYVSTTQGDGGREDYQIRVAGPVIQDKLLASYTYGSSLYDGHTDNLHPFAKVNPAGFSDGGSDGKLGGYDDDTYNIGFELNATDDLKFSGNYYNTQQNRETQPAYILGGAREVAVFATTPYNDMNANPVPISSVLRDNFVGGFGNTVTYGNTIWAGRLPTSLGPGRWDGYVEQEEGVSPDQWGKSTVDFGYGKENDPANRPADQRINGPVADPRNIGAVANTEISNLSADWSINDDWRTVYTYGFVNHDGLTGGAAERDPLYGTFINDVFNGSFQDGTPVLDEQISTNAFSGRPVIDTEAESHEIRFDWAGNELIDGQFGFYYSQVDDRAYDYTVYAPICSDRYDNVYSDDGSPGAPIDEDQPDQSAGCYSPWVSQGAGNLYDNTLPLNQSRSQFIYGLFRDYWSGRPSNDSVYDDHVRSVFSAMNFNLEENVRLRLEGRFTEEHRRINRQSDQFSLAPGQIAYLDNESDVYKDILIGAPNKAAGVTGYGYASGICDPGTSSVTYAALVQNHDPAATIAAGNQQILQNQKDIDDALALNSDLDPSNDVTVPAERYSNTVKTEICIPQKDSDTSSYFAPRIGLDWQPTDENFFYTYAAKGVKAGGFNNSSEASQQRYEEESNWTYEIGTKNTFLDGALTLNGAIYYVDWDNTQGAEAPKGDGGPNANVVVGNIAGITNLGYELSGVYNLTETFYVDFGLSQTNPKYDDDATFDAAQRYYFLDCDPSKVQFAGEQHDANGIIDKGELCGNADVGGNELPRVSQEQYTWGLNYVSDVAGTGWMVNARLDGSYQSEQWVDQMNLAYIPSRTLWNTSIKLTAPENWEFIFWGKNIFDKEYVSGAFVLALFNKYINSYGAGETYGVTAKYNF